MHCRFCHQNKLVDDSVNRLTKIREARFNKNNFKTFRTFIRISLVDFWEMWFEKCADSYAFLKYQIRIIVRYLMFRQGTVLSGTGPEDQIFRRTGARRRGQGEASAG